jgi:hypothetical protein
LNTNRTFAGFGFGPIQSALFVYEAWRSGNFDRLVVSEVDDALVSAVRANRNSYSINVAHPDRIEKVTVTDVVLHNPAKEREAIIDAIADADEFATALPSVHFYDAVVDVMAEGMSGRSRPCVIYAAENNNHAAQILDEQLRDRDITCAVPLNTVIGKMSGVLDDEAAIEKLNLATITPDTNRAILVEAFNHILVSDAGGCQRGIEVFEEKQDLLPFEEAKLYGHNAVHALVGYLAKRADIEAMSEAGRDAGIMSIAREAFVGECGQALIRKHAALGDPLFTIDGMRTHADDLLERMLNPNLHDLVSRVTRDAQRKLGYDDRLFGTMRLVMSQGIEPVQMAKGAAAAVLGELGGEPTRDSVNELLAEIWAGRTDEYADRLIEYTWFAIQEMIDE